MIFGEHDRLIGGGVALYRPIVRRWLISDDLRASGRSGYDRCRVCNRRGEVEGPAEEHRTAGSCAVCCRHAVWTERAMADNTDSHREYGRDLPVGRQG